MAKLADSRDLNPRAADIVEKPGHVLDQLERTRLKVELLDWLWPNCGCSTVSSGANLLRRRPSHLVDLYLMSGWTRACTTGWRAAR